MIERTRPKYLVKLVEHVKETFNENKLEKMMQDYQKNLIKNFLILNKLLQNREKFDEKAIIDARIADILYTTSFVNNLEDLITDNIKREANYIAQGIYQLRYPLTIFQNIPKNLEGKIHQVISEEMERLSKNFLSKNADIINFLKFAYNALKNNASQEIPNLEGLIENTKKLHLFMKTN
ncbi:MAG: hypothetical protein OH319_00105 [Candidatus Parvarchaeota archaeon]|nr:hypothetical protein [Candidatus Jingweiarchaeum tengchongense]MCW1298450.1 hypothetical protein [Candidatus Jingweiarchaeum tengchongense]MCW1300542.1 hypothetical protein [Candidatus Jingweiarchaeum tengchongense]MCW1304983.1 hypothetical protein [Candidatus Jingweiarchaeum tengchongense]MCW1309757.1 hypothetical protein [Candidatus Jingweiarchaeum tengchongense]